MKIKVKTFSDWRVDRIDDAVNLFIEKNEVEVVDVKFSTAAKFDGVRGSMVYSAMVIYKDKD